jgi:hypothetical protein
MRKRKLTLAISWIDRQLGKVFGLIDFNSQKDNHILHMLCFLVICLVVITAGFLSVLAWIQ